MNNAVIISPNTPLSTTFSSNIAPILAFSGNLRRADTELWKNITHRGGASHRTDRVKREKPKTTRMNTVGTVLRHHCNPCVVSAQNEMDPRLESSYYRNGRHDALKTSRKRSLRFLEECTGGDSARKRQRDLKGIDRGIPLSERHKRTLGRHIYLPTYM